MPPLDEKWSVQELRDLKQRAKRLYDEDWEFRSYLKGLSGKRVDAAAHRLSKEASEEVDCRECMNCCRELSPQFDDRDIGRFAKGLGIAPGAFRKEYLIEDDDEPGKFLMRDSPCPFLGRDGCTHYDLRPEECRSFPHLVKKDFLSRTMSVISDQQVCPITFRVYQRLKAELWDVVGR